MIAEVRARPTRNAWLQIHGVPEHDCRRYEVESTGAVALLLESATPDFTYPVEKHCPGQCIADLALHRSENN